MPTPTAHALLSASSSTRWINCPPSAVLNAQSDDTPSPAALQGTAAHALAEFKLRKQLGQTPRRPRKTAITQWIDSEMEDASDAYADYITAITSQHECPFVCIEQRLNLEFVAPDTFGTGDCLIFTDNHLHVIDLKYGAGIVVDAQHNTQLMLYALGALFEFDGIYDVNAITLHIFQPRRNHYSTWDTTPEELRDWLENTVKPAALHASQGEGQFTPGAWCQFCSIKATCRARADDSLRLAQLDFADPAQLTDSEIVHALEIAPRLAKWVKEIEAYALAKAQSGHTWNGFKLVRGRSTRKWVDPALVLDTLNGVYDDLIEIKAPTITAAEKYLGKDEFNRLLGTHVTKPEGAPTLVPDSDPRPPYTVAEEFTTIEEGN